MNNFGYKYLANGFSEYIYVHDYQNIIDFAYYFNIFKPDCVIFEVAEYTFNETYFSYDGMVSMDLNPTLRTAAEEAKINTAQILPPEEITVSQGEDLTKITWETQTPARYAWCRLDTAYDMKRSDNGYEATVPTEVYLDNQDERKSCCWTGKRSAHTSPHKQPRIWEPKKVAPFGFRKTGTPERSKNGLEKGCMQHTPFYFLYICRNFYTICILCTYSVEMGRRSHILL